MIGTNKSISLADFSKGLNTKAGPLQLQDGETPCCLNVTTDVFKTLKRRNGNAVLNGTAVSGQNNGNGAYDFAISPTNHKLLAAWGTKLYYMSNLDGTFHEITSTGQSDSIYHFENFIDNTNTAHAIICNEAKDQPVTWNGSSGSVTPIAAMPKGTNPVVYNNYVLLCDRTSTIQFSEIGDYTDWPAANYFTEPTASGDGFCGWGILRGILYAFKANSIWRLTYTGSSPTWTRRQISFVGTGAPRTIRNVIIPGVGEVLMFLSNDARLYMFDGSDAVPISNQIEIDNGVAPVSFGTINRNSAILYNAWALNYDRTYEYVLCFSNTGASGNKNNVAMVYDYTAKSFWPYDNFNGLSGDMITNSQGEKVPIYLGYAGKGYVIDSGNDDDSSPINSYYWTRKVNSKQYNMLKKTMQAWVTVKTIGELPITFQYRTDWNVEWINGNGILDNLAQSAAGETFIGINFIVGTSKLGGSEAAMKIFDLPNLHNLIQFNINDNSVNPAWNLYEIDMPIEYLGIAKS